MSGGRPAALGGSLLARKGAAIPAIPDESPLVLHLEEHRPEPEDEQQNAAAGFTGPVSNGLRQASERIARIPARLRWAVIVAAAALVIAAVWLSNNSGEILLGPADRTPETEPVVEAGDQGLQLNLTTVREPAPRQVDRADAPGPPKPPAATVALPASAALTITGTSNDETAPASRSVIPVNVPSSEIAPPAARPTGW